MNILNKVLKKIQPLYISQGDSLQVTWKESDTEPIILIEETLIEECIIDTVVVLEFEDWDELELSKGVAGVVGKSVEGLS